MSPWELLSSGSDRWSVPKSHWTTPEARTGTAGPLQRLEPVTLGLKTDHCNALILVLCSRNGTLLDLWSVLFWLVQYAAVTGVFLIFFILLFFFPVIFFFKRSPT